jgi:hypothetical protein
MIRPGWTRLQNGLLVARLLPAYLLLGIVKHLVPLQWLVRWAWRPPASPRIRKVERRLTVGVVRLSQLTGMPDRDCLQRSLLLFRVLSRAGADPTLVVGFKHVHNCTVGHAWVVVDGHALIESDVDLLRFAAVLYFGARGALIPARSGSENLTTNKDPQ